MSNHPIYDPEGSGRWVSPPRPWWRRRRFWMGVTLLIGVVMFVVTLWFLFKVWQTGPGG